MRLLLFVLLFANGTSHAQSNGPADPKRERQKWFHQPRAYPFERIPEGARAAALGEFDRLSPPVKKDGSDRWIELAPRSTPFSPIGPRPISSPTGNRSGRVNAIAIDPRDSAVVYLGAADGGVWKTVNGGVSWTPVSETQPTQAIGSLAIDATQPDTIYAGTGDPVGYAGAGILKSDDGAQSWSPLPGPFGAAYGGNRISALAVHPLNGQILLASVAAGVFGGTGNTGVYRSADGGSNWTLVLPGTPHEIVFVGGFSNVAYASVTGANAGIYRSPDGGATWTAINGSGQGALAAVTAATRIEFTIGLSAPNVLYASLTTGGLLGFYRTTDGGANWTRLSNTPDYCTPQCDFDNVVRVHPANSSIVFAGGVRLYRSVDAGQSWADAGANTYVDQHALAFNASGDKLYLGNDGGAWSTPDAANTAVSWTSLNDTLSLTQFYPGMSIRPLDQFSGFGGSEENGLLRYAGVPAWESAFAGSVGIDCADAGSTAIDPVTPANAYVSCARGIIYKTTTNGASWSLSQTGIDVTDRRNFLPPLALDPSNPQRLYYGTYRVYQTVNAAAGWTAISPDLTGGGQATLRAIAITPVNANYVYTASTTGKVFVTANALAGAGATWADRSAGLPNASAMSIAVDPGNPLTAYVVFSGFAHRHVFRTTDAGVTWRDITSNLPNIPTNDIVVDPVDPRVLFAATDLGVLISRNTGASWEVLGSLLPRVVVTGLTFHPNSRTLRAATFGRGVYDVNVPTTSVPCTFSLDRTATTASALGDTASFTITTSTPECTWGSQNYVPWVVLQPPLSYQGTDTVRFTIAPNGNAPRSSTITAAGFLFTVSQTAANCSFMLSAQNSTIPAAGGEFNAAVATGPGCFWIPAAAPNWIAITGSIAGATGPGSAAYSVAANPNPIARTGSIRIAGQTVQVLQTAANPAPAFDDVAASHPYFDFISLMKQYAITSGCSPSQYCPDDTTTRSQMAVFIIRALLGGDNFEYPRTPFFTDVPAGHPHFPHVQKMRELGITSGCSLTEYCPDNPVTRGQMAVFLIRARLRVSAGTPFPYPATPYFTDVPASHPYFAEVQRMREAGITTGCSADRYCPDDPNTRGQMAVFLIRGLKTP